MADHLNDARAALDADYAHDLAVPILLGGILDALIAIAERLETPTVPVEPGACWHEPGVTWPNGDKPRCELRAGHAGRGSLGGTATWLDAGKEADRD